MKVVSPPASPLEILRDGAPLSAEIGPGLTTPVEILLVSIGTCFALSCHAAFTLRGQERVGFEVSVTGRKAPQLPSRLANIRLEATFDASLPASGMPFTVEVPHSERPPIFPDEQLHLSGVFVCHGRLQRLAHWAIKDRRQPRISILRLTDLKLAAVKI